MLAEVSPAFVSAYHDPLKELVGLSLTSAELDSEHAVVPLSAMEELLQQHPERVALVQVDEGRLVSWFGGLQQKYGLAPDVRISAPTDFISQVHYAEVDRGFYFFANFSPGETHTFTADLSVRRGREAWLWDATSGLSGRYPGCARKSALEITLAPSESKLIVFEGWRRSAAVSERLEMT